MPKIENQEWTKQSGAPHPITGQNDGPYDHMAPGDRLGLSQFGVRLERLPAGSRSSHRHWHETEDEFVYVVSGEVILVEDTETVMVPGDCAGWPAGQGIAHCLENRSPHDAVLLVVGTRSNVDRVHYPDHDLIFHRDGATRRFSRTDGSPVKGGT